MTLITATSGRDIVCRIRFNLSSSDSQIRLPLCWGWLNVPVL
jgi:hypothetical protein